MFIALLIIAVLIGFGTIGIMPTAAVAVVIWLIFKAIRWNNGG